MQEFLPLQSRITTGAPTRTPLCQWVWGLWGWLSIVHHRGAPESAPTRLLVGIEKVQPDAVFTACCSFLSLEVKSHYNKTEIQEVDFCPFCFVVWPIDYNLLCFLGTLRPDFVWINVESKVLWLLSLLYLIIYQTLILRSNRRETSQSW